MSCRNMLLNTQSILFYSIEIGPDIHSFVVIINSYGKIMITTKYIISYFGFNFNRKST